MIYQGRPEDPEAFLRFYIEDHLPIMRTLPGLQGIEIELGAEGGDPYANEAGLFMIARFLFNSLDELRAALRSEAREQARRDRANFPPFHGSVRHQAVETIEVTERDG